MADTFDPTPSDLLIAAAIGEAAHLALATKLVAARANALRIERARRAADDASDDSALAAIDRRMAALDDRRSELAERVVASRSPVVAADPTRAVIRGVVSDDTGTPVPGLTVSAMLGDQRLGAADTDAMGSYAIAIAECNALSHGKDTQQYDERLASGKPSGDVMLWVSRGHSVVLRDTARIALAPGITFVRDLVVGSKA